MLSRSTFRQQRLGQGQKDAAAERHERGGSNVPPAAVATAFGTTACGFEGSLRFVCHLVQWVLSPGRFDAAGRKPKALRTRFAPSGPRRVRTHNFMRSTAEGLNTERSGNIR